MSTDARRWARWWVALAVVLVAGFVISKDIWVLIIGLIAFAPYE